MCGSGQAVNLLDYRCFRDALSDDDHSVSRVLIVSNGLFHRMHSPQLFGGYNSVGNNCGHILDVLG